MGDKCCTKWEIKQISNDNIVIQKVEEGTKGSTILDLILSNRDEMIERVEVVGTLEESNHILEFNTMQAQVIEQRQTTVLDSRRGDFNNLTKFRKDYMDENPKGGKTLRCF